MQLAHSNHWLACLLIYRSRIFAASQLRSNGELMVCANFDKRPKIDCSFAGEVQGNEYSYLTSSNKTVQANFVTFFPQFFAEFRTKPGFAANDVWSASSFFPGHKEILNQTQQFCEDISISIYIVKYIVYFVKTYKEKNKN